MNNRAGMNERVVELGYLAGWRLVRALPGPVAAGLFNAGADYATRRAGRAARQLADNLRRVVGPGMPEEEFQELVRAAMRSTARYYMEAFRLPSLSTEQHRTGFHLERGYLLGEDVAAGRGAVIALPHAGNWDAAGAWAVAMGWPITTVAERLKPESVYRRFLAFRERLGMRIVPATGGDRPPLDVLAERLGQAHIVPLLADRDLSARGVEVDFFGGRTRMPAGPALLAMRTGAPLYAVSMWYEKSGSRGYLEGPLRLPPADSAPLDERVRQVTQMIADRLAAGIAAHPADWHMLQRLWLADSGPAGPGTPGAGLGRPGARGTAVGQ